MTTDSGMPSRSAPSAMALPDPGCAPSEGWRAPDRLRCLAPRRARNTLANEYAVAPATAPAAVGSTPPCSYASSTSSNETAEMSTPLPKAMTSAIH